MTAAISGSNSTGLVTPATASARAVPGASSALLPPAEKPSLGQLQGAMADLFLIMSQLRDAQTGEAKSRCDAAQASRDVAAHEREQAMKRAQEAAEKGGFFDWISKDIGLAGAVGLVTFNYALVAADVAAHKAEVVDNIKVDVVDVGAVATGRYDVLAADILLRKTDLAPTEARALLEKCGIPKDAPGVSDEDVKPIAKDLLMLNLFVASVAATICSAGTTTGVCIALAGVAISVSGEQVAKHEALDGVFGKGSSKWIGLGMQAYGAAASGMSGLAPGAAIGAGAAAAGAMIQGGTKVAHATDQVVLAIHQKECDDANIDAEGAKLKLARLERMIEDLIEGIKEVAKSGQKGSESLQASISTIDQTRMALATGTRV